MQTKNSTTDRQHALSYRTALQCENAKSPTSACRCRCAGAGHGVARGRPEDLPLDDPHAVRPRPGRCRVCGCTENRACIGGSGPLPRGVNPWRWVGVELLRSREACHWLDREKTFCSAHSPEELAAWGYHLGPPHPRPPCAESRAARPAVDAAQVPGTDGANAVSDAATGCESRCGKCAALEACAARRNDAGGRAQLVLPGVAGAATREQEQNPPAFGRGRRPMRRS